MNVQVHQVFLLLILRVQIISKSCNLTGQKHFGPYLRNQTFHGQKEMKKLPWTEITFYQHKLSHLTNFKNIHRHHLSRVASFHKFCKWKLSWVTVSRYWNSKKNYVMFFCLCSYLIKQEITTVTSITNPTPQSGGWDCSIHYHV